jgi:cell division cycle 2-like protein
MAACKRPAAVLDAGHATTTQGSSVACKRSRPSLRSSDEYEEVTRLGKGGFGVVVQARHRATGKTVAIKYATELKQEASFLEACSGNPYVVAFEGLMLDHATGGHCLAMEYVAAPTLHTFLWERRRDPPLPEAKVRAFMWKLRTGTKMMQDRHVINRDIKLANILVGQDGELVKMCDLGLALHMSDSPPYC